jgi:FtsZ-binding cell division protein ZapB
MKTADLIEKSKRAAKRFFSTGKAMTAEEFIEKNKAEMEEVKRLANEQDALREERNSLDGRIDELNSRISKILSDMAVKNNMSSINYSIKRF